MPPPTSLFLPLLLGDLFTFYYSPKLPPKLRAAYYQTAMDTFVTLLTDFILPSSASKSGADQPPAPLPTEYSHDNNPLCNLSGGCIVA